MADPSETAPEATAAPQDIEDAVRALVRRAYWRGYADGKAGRAAGGDSGPDRDPADWRLPDGTAACLRDGETLTAHEIAERVGSTPNSVCVCMRRQRYAGHPIAERCGNNLWRAVCREGSA